MTDPTMPAPGPRERHQPRPAPDHVVHLTGLTPAALGPTLFQRVYHCTRMAAEHYAPGRHRMTATYDPETHERTGYRLLVPDALAAARIRLCHDLARQCRPMPWAKPW